MALLLSSRVTVMVCDHKRYKLGDEHDYKIDDYGGWQELRQAIKENNHVLHWFYRRGYRNAAGRWTGRVCGIQIAL